MLIRESRAVDSHQAVRGDYGGWADLSDTITECGKFVQDPKLHRKPMKIYECWRYVFIFAPMKNDAPVF